MARKRNLLANERIQLRFDDQNPLPGNKCRKKGCKGTVVQKYLGVARNRPIYDTPACDTCGRTYLFAKNAPKVGREEFMAMASVPFTI